MNNELRKNAEGYTDPTAAATLNRPESGDIWEYNGTLCLIIKNHGTFSTVLQLTDLDYPENVTVETHYGAKFLSPQRITYGQHFKMTRYVETVSVEDFKRVIEAVETALAIELPRVETAGKDEAKDVTRPVDDDPVNRPAHYTSGGIECIDAIRASMTPEEFKGFLKGNAMKYLWRYRLKGKPAQDLEKASWYLSRLAGTMEGV